MEDWPDSLTNCLVVGKSDPILLASIDEIIAWYATLGRTDSTLAVALLKRFGKRQFHLRFEVFLDQLIVSTNNRHRMFPTSLSLEDGKKRYRYLIRVFHPDRGFNQQNWLNSRAETINHAYKMFRENYVITSSKSRTQSTVDIPVTAKARPRRLRDVKIKYRTEVWRKRFGDPQRLQRRIIYGLVSVCALLVLFFYLSTREPIDNQPHDPRAKQEQKQEKSAGFYDVSNKATNQNTLILEEPLSEKNQKIIGDAEWLNSNATESNFNTGLMLSPKDD